MCAPSVGNQRQSASTNAECSTEKRTFLLFQHWEHGQWWKIKKLISPLLIASARRCVQEAKGPNRINACPVTKAWGWVGIALRIVFGQWPGIFWAFFCLKDLSMHEAALAGGEAKLASTPKRLDINACQSHG